MKIASADIYALDIPFVEAFSHSLARRDRSGSVIVKVTTDSGISGFGEGVPRPYVTGETRETSIGHVRDVLLPAFLGTDLNVPEVPHVMSFVNGLFPRANTGRAVIQHASRCAVELAMIDCLLRAAGLSLAAVLTPKSQQVTYSGVITSGPVGRIEKIAQRFMARGFRSIKIKVTRPEDIELVCLVREIMGPDVSLRLDANGAFGRDAAVRFLAAAAEYDVECIEQPIPRGDPVELAALRASTPVPVMVDESLVTLRDAEELIAAKACDFFNLRISKCGGLYNTLAIAKLAESAGVGIQLGCQVGETAILSAAGRHVAASLGEVRFVEGSYGTHLLIEDIAQEAVAFGYGGKAPVLTGPGLGIDVREDVLRRHATEVISLR